MYYNLFLASKDVSYVNSYLLVITLEQFYEEVRDIFERRISSYLYFTFEGEI